MSRANNRVEATAEKFIFEETLDAGEKATLRALLGLGTAATSNTGDFAAASHTHVSADIADATSAATANTVVKRGAGGQASFGTASGTGVSGIASSSGVGVLGISVNGTGVSGSATSGTAGNFASDTGRGAQITSNTDVAALIGSDSGTGAQITSNSGTAATVESTSGDHLNIGSGKVIFNNAGGQVSVSDIEITDSTKGIILKSPNATRWRIQVSNAGALTVTSL